MNLSNRKYKKYQHNIESNRLIKFGWNCDKNYPQLEFPVMLSYSWGWVIAESVRLRNVKNG